MKATILALFSSLFLGTVFGSPVPPSQSNIKLTVMVYMNAKSEDLDCDALQNIRQMATAFPLKRINVVVELGRLGYPRECPKDEDTNNNWAGTLFFTISRSTKPIPADAVQDPPQLPATGQAGADINMGDGGSLRQFVLWAQRRFQAEHYLLIIWGHGRGYQLVSRFNSDQIQMIEADLGFKSVSYDEQYNSYIYNHDLRVALDGVRDLDVIGFDSCLMGAIETAYALRDRAALLVASEELVPGTGWDYTRLLRSINDIELLTSDAIATALVNDYQKTYQDSKATTLSALNLKDITQLANSISDFSLELSKALSSNSGPALKSQIETARSHCLNYGQTQGFTNPIDLVHFLMEFIDQHPSSQIEHSAHVLLQQASSGNLVLANYASLWRKGDYGSFGVSIYFPKTKDDYRNPNSSGYWPSSCKESKHPVDFVCNLKWADFIAKYLGVEREGHYLR